MRETVLSTTAKTVASRNPGIDLLRGLAIVLVVFNHLGLRIPLEKSALAAVLPGWLLNRLNWNGYEAVYVFFVISGFLIAGNALRRWGSLAAIDARAFYARRFARIVPCLLALLAVLSVLHLRGVPDYVIHRPGQSLPRALAAALGLHLNWYEGRTGYLPGNWDVLWPLSIEEAFYLGFPLACLLLRVDLQLVIFGFEHSDRYPDAPEVPRTILLNPVITPLSQDMEEDWEGCLSVPGLRGAVNRYTLIRYQGIDPQGMPIDRRAEGFHARVVQHECDHLIGRLYPSRITDFSKFGFTDVLFPGMDVADD